MNGLLISNIALWVLVVALSLVVVALVRQIGLLHERIAPVGALMLRRGLEVGAAAPAMSVPVLGGGTVSIGGERDDGRSTLLMFVSPTCPICKVLLPVLKSSRVGERDWLDIVLASDGSIEEHRQFISAHGLDGFPYVLSSELGVSFQVGRLPFAALLDAQGVLRARGIVNSREHLESLFEAKQRGVASLQDYFDARKTVHAA
jgi:methylamine dehydrogenase accessory protein MauD